MLRNRYFVWLGEGTEPLPWQPPAAEDLPRRDCRYFGGAFAAFERDSDVGGLTIHLTWDLESLPSYGPDVVAVVTGDEHSRIPRWFDRVRATYRTYGTRPRLPAGSLRRASPAYAAALAVHARDWSVYLPGLLRYARRRLSARALPPIRGIPLGCFDDGAVPWVPFERRTTDVWFWGSLENANERGAALAGVLSGPKTIVRRHMLSGLETLRRERPDIRARLQLTGDFPESVAADPTAYARSLMDARICLVPRGTSPETFRLYEAMRSGCVLVGDRVPGRWYLDGAPIVPVDDWRRLSSVLASLLDDPDRMLELHRASLDWWRQRCSEEALGRFMARTMPR